MHLRCCGLTPDELAGVSGWQDVSDVQRDCLVRDVYDEKEIKTSDRVAQTEVEDGVTQDVTLESELWTFDEVEWHETAQDTTTIKYVPVQIRPAVATLRGRVAKVATEETGPQQVRAWKLFLSLDKMLFHTSDQQHKPHQGNHDPYCADRGRKRTRNTETIPTNVRSPKDHETKN